MNSYVVLLRGVNVSKKNIIKMIDLKNILLENDFQNVQTYIQSGNIILNTLLQPSVVESKIKELLLLHFNANVSVFVLTFDTLQKIHDKNPFDENLPGNRVFVTFLNKSPDSLAIKTLNSINFENEKWIIKDTILYFYLPLGMASSKWNNAFAEKKLGVIATGRNINTIKKLLALKN